MRLKLNICPGICCFLIGLVFLCLPGCAPEPEGPVTRFSSLSQIPVSQFPDFRDSLAFQGLATSIDQSLVYFNKVPGNRQYRYGSEIYTAQHLIRSLETFRRILTQTRDPETIRELITSRYLVYAAAGNEQSDVLFTGYFEAIYPGSMTPSDQYAYPLYSRPDDLVSINLSLFSPEYEGKSLMGRVDMEKKQVVPYYSREEINTAPDFSIQARPLVWLKNRVDRFFLEIQGSGRIILDTGGQMRVHYAAKNGLPYRSVGRYLIEKDEIPKEQMSMQAIRSWLERHPERMEEVLYHNESFVFFREEQGGPYGSLGVPVSPFRSIATDRRLFPAGGLCFIEARLPDQAMRKPLDAWEQASFFALNQDTGGAIRGAARADIFCGNGSYAEYASGHMNVYGKMYFLVLRPEAVK